uniref:Peptidoglycan binding domain protein n=1 Tax=Colletotrichum fructicola (strain Nara gc5) TaxID=1213859 RepID=L2GGQ2_COLFN
MEKLSRPSSYRRIVVCVDGTWFNEDGREGHGHGNNSNVFRIYASVKIGKTTDGDGNEVEQIAKYFPGIGTNKMPLNRFNDGMTGKGCEEQIQEVYASQYCCREIKSKDDEVWLFGFSRGAYVVRAVSVLLNNTTIREVLNVKDTSMWKAIKSFGVRRRRTGLAGQEFRWRRENTRDPPKIRFLGLFDTVKMTFGKDTIDISDLSFTNEIRHALAINEERKTFPLLPIDPIENTEVKQNNHRCIQAWFVGAHADMGGGADHDGLSLYPLQWMMIESMAQGLVLDYDPPDCIKGLIDSPMDLAFPKPPKLADLGDKVLEADVPASLLKTEPWTLRYSTGPETETPETCGSERRAEHDIEQAFESDLHPGIIIHDSEGFQAGNSKEVSAFKKFLKARSGSPDIKQNLHAIWLCIDTDTDRPVQSALANMLQEVIEICPLTPVVIVGTKKDKYLLFNRGKMNETELLSAREAIFRQKFAEEPETSPFWPELKANFAFVSKDDQDSIKALIQMTMESFSSPIVSEAMVAAQVPDIDAKMDQAIEKTLKLLRATVAAAGIGLGTGVVSAMTTPTISKLLCQEIAHGSFGIPKASIGDINDVLSGVVWRNLAPFMAMSLSQSFIIWGGVICLTCTTVVGGIPLAFGAPLLEAPAAVRMILKCACDLILILDQAFSQYGKGVTKENIKAVAAMYLKSRVKTMKDGVEIEKSRKRAVHGAVNDLVPWFSNRAFEAYSRKTMPKYREGLREILRENRFQPGAFAEFELDDDLTLEQNSVSSLSLANSEDDKDIKLFNGESKDFEDGDHH